ncbi:hypothetical protein [uncultured Paracoccus sp.]|uniref:hypothetical protein n=1 Tax=uncultured Paracoccus sp. TaxID=189685 RepID=UPI0026101BD8|nr:hypothetical protein [uncultured Paracoccus sp.]
METSFVELPVLGSDRLIPVFAASRLADLEYDIDHGELPVVAYPINVLFGRVVRDEIWPRLDGLTLRPKAETALTLAALQLASTGVAVAWVPETLAFQPVRTRDEGAGRWHSRPDPGRPRHHPSSHPQE